MDNRSGIGLLILLGLGAYVYSTQAAASDNPAPGITYDPNANPNPAPSDFGYPVFDAQPEGTVTYTDVVTEDYIPEDFMQSNGNWKINSYPTYAALIATTETRNGIPTDLLARQLYQESRFLDQYIFGPPNHAGAQGIAQFELPTALQYGLTNRSDPNASIAKAGEYMRDLFRAMGNWQDALMAYDWGIGNVKKWIKAGRPPTDAHNYPPVESVNYVAQITADVPVA